MSYREDPVWLRLQAYQFDAPDTALTFAMRLARENGWTASYGARVLEEYRRFCFLAKRAGHSVTPSEDVDQAWHMHLLYSRMYWQDFCPNVLEADFHHGPTLGGGQERQKYHDWYGETLASYERLFETPPPGDIWPSPVERFRSAALFRRVNLADVIVLPRPATLVKRLMKKI